MRSGRRHYRRIYFGNFKKLRKLSGKRVRKLPGESLSPAEKWLIEEIVKYHNEEGKRCLREHCRLIELVNIAKVVIPEWMKVYGRLVGWGYEGKGY